VAVEIDGDPVGADDQAVAGAVDEVGIERDAVRQRLAALHRGRS
jgi:hypothetical protein